MFDERGHSIFKGVDENTLSLFLNDTRCERICVEKGNTIFSPSVYRKSVGIITAGSATVRKKHNNGEFVVMRRMGEGDIFGVAALFNQSEQYVTEIIADSDCKVTFFSEEMIAELLKNDTNFVTNYISVLSNRINFLNMLISGYSAQTACGKLSHFLIMNEQNSVVTVNYSMTKLSDRLGIGRASLYRALDDFEADGIIHRDGKNIYIKDMNTLKIFI